jgi:hypothetical protein
MARSKADNQVEIKVFLSRKAVELVILSKINRIQWNFTYILLPPSSNRKPSTF